MDEESNNAPVEAENTNPVETTEAPASKDTILSEEDVIKGLDAEENNDQITNPDKSEETTDDAEEESEEEAEDSEAEESQEEESTEELSDEEKQKQHNREMAEKRLQAKQAKDTTVQQSQQEYVDQAEDEKDLALRQLQVDAYNNRVDSNTNKLTNAYEKAVKDFDILSDSSPEIQEEISQALDAFQAMHVTIDQFGNPTEIRGDLYQYLQTKADSIQRLTQRGARDETKAKAKSKANAMTPPSRSPKEGKKDPVMEGLLSELKE